MKANILVLLCGMFVAGLAKAECPTSLSEMELAKCVEIESSGINYQDWTKNQDEMADDATISPITREDVLEVAPAAGPQNPDSMMGD